MINFDGVINKKRKEHNLNWPKSSDHSYRILIIGGLESVKTNTLFNFTSHQWDIDKIYLYAKYLYEAKYTFLINIR